MNITANPWSVCLEVQKYLKKKYGIDFVTSRTKIFKLAPKLKGRYTDERKISCEQFAEDLYALYRKEKEEKL